MSDPNEMIREWAEKNPDKVHSHVVVESERGTFIVDPESWIQFRPDEDYHPGFDYPWVVDFLEARMRDE